jgi:predicted TIM-barrel fold metal-dependent hydrolase
VEIFEEPKVDCHVHIVDPRRFPYDRDTPYRPAGQEIGTAAQFRAVMQAYGVRHALLVGPNSGYGFDNRCMLDAFGPEGCLWASDWPHLKAPERLDYGPLLLLAQDLMPDARVRRQVMWETPRLLFGFGA